MGPMFRKVTKLTLAGAIAKATTDENMRSKAIELSTKLQAEDGLQCALDSLQEFIRDEVDTGKWATKHEEVLKHRARPPMGRIAWFRKMLRAEPFAATQ